MQVTFSLSDGRKIEGVVLAVGPKKLRVVAPGQNDALVFQLISGTWTTEEGEPAQLDSVIAVSGVDSAALMQDFFVKTRCAS